MSDTNDDRVGLLDPAATQAPPLTSAVDLVLKTAELLELALSHLEVEHLTCCQLVSSHWKQTINASPALRSTLHFEFPENTLVPSIGYDPLSHNLAHYKPACEIKDSGRAIFYSNPALPLEWTEALTHGKASEAGLFQHMAFDIVAALTRPPRPWTQIMPTLPPIDFLGLHLEFQSQSTDPAYRVGEGRVLLSVLLSVPEGIRVGDLIGFVKGGIDHRERDIRQRIDIHDGVSATVCSPYPYSEGSWTVLQAYHADRGRRGAVVELPLRPHWPATD